MLYSVRRVLGFNASPSFYSPWGIDDDSSGLEKKKTVYHYCASPCLYKAVKPGRMKNMDSKQAMAAVGYEYTKYGPFEQVADSSQRLVGA